MDPIPTEQENPNNKQPNMLVKALNSLLTKILRRDNSYERVRLNQETDSSYVSTFKELVYGLHKGYAETGFASLDEMYLVDEREGSEEIPASELWQKGVDNIRNGRIIVIPSRQLNGLVRVDPEDVCVSPDVDTRFYIDFKGRKPPAKRGQAIPIVIVDTHPLFYDLEELKSTGGSAQVEQDDLGQIVISVLQARACILEAEKRGEYIVDEATYRKAIISYNRPKKGWQED